MNSFLIDVENRIQRNAFALFQYKEIFSDGDLDDIVSLCKKVPKESVTVGDVGEEGKLEVGRFMTDVKNKLPAVINDDLSHRMISILKNQKSHELFSRLMDGDYHIRRIQINTMKEGSFLSKHVDTHSNNDYIFSIVLQLESEYDGGEFVIYFDGGKEVVKTKRGDILINRCEVPHEVNKVLEGDRKSLVFFLSKKDCSVPNSSNKQI